METDHPDPSNNPQTHGTKRPRLSQKERNELRKNNNNNNHDGPDPTLPPNAKYLPDSKIVELTEGSGRILFNTARDVFYNKAQVVNRDVSVLAIRAWARTFDDDLTAESETKKKHENSRAKKRMAATSATDTPEPGPVADAAAEAAEAGTTTAAATPATSAQPRKLTLFEGLSASGLRSIRYAQEIPELHKIIANDLDPTAVTAIQRNMNHCSIPAGRIVPQQGDCYVELVKLRDPVDRVHVVDLDPYGSATKFLETAVQAVADGGLLAVTCTDLSVLCAGQADACTAKYASVPVKGPFYNEQALRIVLNSVAQAAARFRRNIVPMLSLQLDFYVRVFVRVYSNSIEANRLGANTSMIYKCTGCPAFHLQPLARTEWKGDQAHHKYSQGPPVGSLCPECEQKMHIGGPMWNGPLHNVPFIERMLAILKEDLPQQYLITKERLTAVLTLAKDELQDVPLFYEIPDMCNTVHCPCPPYSAITSALLHLGHRVSLSHCTKNSIKTDAPPKVIADILRGWCKEHQHASSRSNNTKRSAAAILLSKPMTHAINFEVLPAAKLAKNVKRYLENPEGLRGGPMSIARRARDEPKPAAASTSAATDTAPAGEQQQQQQQQQ